MLPVRSLVRTLKTRHGGVIVKKLYFVIFILTILAGNVFSQEETNDWINFGWYAGWLSSTTENDFSLNSHIGADFRARFSENWSIEGFQVYNWNDNEWSDRASINSLGLVYKNQDWRVDIGNVATPTTFLHRPYPVSSGGQFETLPQSRMPGGTYGVRVQKGRFLVGLAERDGDYSEFHVGYKTDSVKVSAWTGPVNSGIGLTTKHDSVETISNLSEDIFSNTILLDAKVLTVFSDIGYKFQEEIWEKSEVGILKEIALASKLKLLGCVSYRFHSEEPVVYLWLHF